MESPWKERAVRLGSLDVDGAEDDKLSGILLLGLLKKLRNREEAI
tara:strand:+ start:3013 stop:3147 length:135 start_codon:yes stop_codon:yes gene_type:complete